MVPGERLNAPAGQIDHHRPDGGEVVPELAAAGAHVGVELGPRRLLEQDDDPVVMSGRLLNRRHQVRGDGRGRLGGERRRVGDGPAGRDRGQGDPQERAPPARMRPSVPALR